MSSAKAALESDTRVLAWEAGRKWGVRVNTISAGPLGSRAAKAIGFIDDMIRYSYANAPVQKELEAREVGAAAAFLLSPLASAVSFFFFFFFFFFFWGGGGGERRRRRKNPKEKLGRKKTHFFSLFLSSHTQKNFNSSFKVTGACIYVDNGLNAMGLAVDSQSLARDEPAPAAAKETAKVAA